MPADNTQLDAAISEAVDNAAQISTVADSVVAYVGSVGQQIIDALVADNKLDQANTDRAVANVRTVVSQNQANAKRIADALLAGTPQAPPQTAR